MLIKEITVILFCGDLAFIGIGLDLLEGIDFHPYQPSSECRLKCRKTMLAHFHFRAFC